jgi:hypothetical protein
MDAEQVRMNAQRVWAKVLGTDVHAETDFFEVGGHSFLAIRIIALLDQVLPEPTPMEVLFDHPVFGDFAGTVANRMNSAAAN